MNILTLILSMTAFSQVERIEPPFWWAGMHRPELQLMLYGPAISKYELYFSGGIKITEVQKTENPNYLFVTLNIQSITPGSYELQFYKDNQIAGSSSYEFKQRRENSALRKGFDSSDLIYLIMPDRFADGAPENDFNDDTVENVDRKDPGGRHGGDIQGIIDHLDYLDDLGVTAIWSTPLLEDNEPGYSYHTYAQSDYYKIDPRFGTNDDYRCLASKMHQRDMKLIMDYVTNHWGSKHWMIQDLPSKDWIHYWEEGENGFKSSSHRMTTQFDSNASRADREACMDGWFDATMPDVNQENPLVLNYLIQNAIWWVEFADLDGFRVDTFSYNDKQGIASWTKAVMDEYPNFNIAGEIWMHNQAQMAYWQKDSKIGAIDHYNSHLPTVMDFTLLDAIMVMFSEDDQEWDKGMFRAYENFTNDFLYPDINNILVFAGNHDTNRINEIYGSSLNKYKMAMTLIATVRGIPQVYYGDEIGMVGNKDLRGDGDIRRDFPGGWKDDLQNAFNSEGRTVGQKAFFEFSKKLFNWRKTATVIHSGKTMQFVPENNVYVYFRYADHDKVMVVINNHPEMQILELDRFKEMLNDTFSGTEVLSGKEVVLKNELRIGGKSAVIIQF